MPLDPTVRIIVLAITCAVGLIVYLTAGNEPGRAEVKEVGRIAFAFALLALLWALCVR